MSHHTPITKLVTILAVAAALAIDRFAFAQCADRNDSRAVWGYAPSPALGGNVSYATGNNYTAVHN